MEISPIIGIRTVPTVKAPPAEAGLTALFDIEANAGLGDDRYTGAGKKAAGAEESGDEEFDTEAEIVLPVEPDEDEPSRSINYIA